MNFKRLSALVMKEILGISRDPSSLAVAFILPIIFLFIFGYAINLDSSNIKMAIVSETDNPLVRSLKEAFFYSHFFDPRFVTDRRDAEALMLSGKIRGFLVIPAQFNKDLIDSPVGAKIQLIVDGSVPEIAIFLQNDVMGTLSSWTQKKQSHSSREKFSFNYHPRFWFNQELTSQFFILPGSIAIIMTMVGSLLTSLVIAREWERGTLECLFATPVLVIEFFLSKLIPYFFLGIFSMILCSLIVIFLFHIPFRGSFGLLFLLTAIFLLAALGQGLLISTATRNQLLASQIAMSTAFLPSFTLSGFIFDLNSIPVWVQDLSYLIPARYFITVLHSLFLSGNVWSNMISSAFSMLTLAFLFLGLSYYKISKRLY